MIAATLLTRGGTMGRVIFDGHLVHFDGVPQQFVDEWTHDGIVGKGAKVFYPKDGEAFVRNLPVAISGSYLRARLD